jgi:hypothetical protein
MPPRQSAPTIGDALCHARSGGSGAIVSHTTRPAAKPSDGCPSVADRPLRHFSTLKSADCERFVLRNNRRRQRSPIEKHGRVSAHSGVFVNARSRVAFDREKAVTLRIASNMAPRVTGCGQINAPQFVALSALVSRQVAITPELQKRIAKAKQLHQCERQDRRRIAI